MHRDLVAAFGRVVEALKNDERCKGGWHYGSVGRGEGDVYSDYDPVFLVADQDFEAFAGDVPKIVASACDELLICWPENYNSDHFKNFCSVLRIGENLHQHDFFVLNADRAEQWWCRQHLKGCSSENIIFDRAGEVAALLERGLRTDNHIPDALRAMDTYWFHVTMLIKYFKRRDVFKLLKNIDMIFHAHVDLLLSQYDALDWGAWETKVKRCVPQEKQSHLLAYFAPAGIEELEAAVRRGMLYFREDAKEICRLKSLEYPDAVAEKTVAYFHRRLAEDDAAEGSGWNEPSFPALDIPPPPAGGPPPLNFYLR